jgi:type III restriction enzyme
MQEVNSHLSLPQKIKIAVEGWRERDYEGASPITRRLLEFWFKEEHFLPDGSPFSFWRCQREAIETIIYLYEVCKLRFVADIYRSFSLPLPLIGEDFWPKYCLKMATGSGKTLVMAMAMLWQYFNKLYNPSNEIRYGSHFLLLAPNLIVFDRLKQDFQDNKIFRDFPFIPKEWEADFQFQIILQSSPEEPHSLGVLHLTNIQQLYERGESEEGNPIQGLLGSKPKKEEIAEYEELLERLQSYEDLLIINDEAHHVHSDDLEWAKVIKKIHQGIEEKFGNGLLAQLDFTATPKDLMGNPFPHIVYDYPLREAVRDGIVKRPKIGLIENPPSVPSKDFVKANQIQIDTGIEKLREFQKEFEGTGKKPVLFVVADTTQHADKVGKYLENRGFEGKVLVIHTDTKGQITKKELAQAREAARKIDSPDNPYDCIVSVMMLKEGWDVKNVCVIVPLRAFDSPILPEQTLGRGLRRMFPDNPDLQEKLIVIDHPRFRQLWEAEIQKGEIEVDITTAGRVYEPSNRIFVVPEKINYDIEVPILEGGYQRKAPDISKLDIEKLPRNLFKLEEIEVPPIMYKEKDLIEQKVEQEKLLAFDYQEIASLYLSYITKAILTKVSAPSSLFSDLVPKVKEYIENYLFGEKIDLDDTDTVKKLNQIPIREKIFEIFTKEINELWQFEETPARLKYFRTSEMQVFHTSEPIYEAEKCVFNALPYSRRSELEKEFMKYLDEQEEVEKFTKIFSRIPLRIPYYEEGFLRHYVPDFIVCANDEFYLIETKGLEEEELELKMRSARDWCKRVSELSGKKWRYLKISKQDFEKYKGEKFSNLVKYLMPEEEAEKPPIYAPTTTETPKVKEEAKAEIIEEEEKGEIYIIPFSLIQLTARSIVSSGVYLGL